MTVIILILIGLAKDDYYNYYYGDYYNSYYGDYYDNYYGTYYDAYYGSYYDGYYGDYYDVDSFGDYYDYYYGDYYNGYYGDYYDGYYDSYYDAYYGSYYDGTYGDYYGGSEEEYTEECFDNSDCTDYDDKCVYWEVTVYDSYDGEEYLTLNGNTCSNEEDAECYNADDSGWSYIEEEESGLIT